jgi:hypothetical protein
MQKISIKLIITALCFFNFNLQAMEPGCDLQSIDDIPEYCVSLVKKLSEQPLITSYDSTIKHHLPCRSLPLQNDCDGPICRILSENAKLKIEENWHVHDYGDGCNPYKIELWLTDGFAPCSLNTLQLQYKDTIEKLKPGWQPDSSKKLKSLFAQYAGKDKTDHLSEWCLFSKTRSILQEDIFIKCLIAKFGLIGAVSCHDHWNPNIGILYETMYLLVKKDYIAQVNSIFGFGLTISD